VFRNNFGILQLAALGAFVVVRFGWDFILAQIKVASQDGRCHD
jgi:hypothetical protein